MAASDSDETALASLVQAHKPTDQLIKGKDDLLEVSTAASDGARAPSVASSLEDDVARMLDMEVLFPEAVGGGPPCISLSAGAERAVKNFQESTTNFEATIKDVEQSEEGLTYWATKGMNCKNGSALRQSMVRALKKDDRAKDIWLGLPDADKEAFTEAWAVDSNFEFVDVKKSYTVSHTKLTQNKGRMLTVFRIANELGGWNIESCRRGAVLYAQTAMAVDPNALVSDKSWSGLKMFMYFEHLVSTTNMQDWRKEVTNMTKEQNPEWQDKADLNRAKIAYAVATGKKVS